MTGIFSGVRSLSTPYFDDGVHCCEVLEDASGRGKVRCKNIGKYQLNNRLYCGIHFPPLIEKRYAERAARKRNRMKGIGQLHNKPKE